MIVARNGQIATKTGHDHDRRPLCLNVKFGHNGHNGAASSGRTAAGSLSFWRQAETPVMMVRPILNLSPFFSRWALNMRRPFSQVPFVELRSSTYQ